MIKLLNILAVAYLAIAPGMNVSRLLHAVDFCQYLEPHVVVAHVETHSDCTHHTPKDQQPTETPKDDCPHLTQLTVDMGAIPVVSIVSSSTPLNPALCWIAEATVTCTYSLPASPGDARAPPDTPRTGITQILI